jgi:hypothetical protein
MNAARRSEPMFPEVADWESVKLGPHGTIPLAYENTL